VEVSDELPFASDGNPSELLSAELDVFGHDPVYEEAARTAGRL
jgi:hypothetical protein